jgi:hypothetical protein
LRVFALLRMCSKMYIHEDTEPTVSQEAIRLSPPPPFNLHQLALPVHT